MFLTGRSKLKYNVSYRILVYRYVPGAIYRPHIDGAWPASGVDPVTVSFFLYTISIDVSDEMFAPPCVRRENTCMIPHHLINLNGPG